MSSWTDFSRAAPRIAAIFDRRQIATGNLCLLATLRVDGFPRISPVEPRVFEGQLWIAGMPRTLKFEDLIRDPRLCLHTATTDTHVTDGDVKLWGIAENVQEPNLRRRYAQTLFDDTGFDIRDQEFGHCFRTDIVGASAVEVIGDHLDITIWKPGGAERVVRKH